MAFESKTSCTLIVECTKKQQGGRRTQCVCHLDWFEDKFFFVLFWEGFVISFGLVWFGLVCLEFGKTSKIYKAKKNYRKSEERERERERDVPKIIQIGM